MKRFTLVLLVFVSVTSGVNAQTQDVNDVLGRLTQKCPAITAYQYDDEASIGREPASAQLLAVELTCNSKSKDELGAEITVAMKGRTAYIDRAGGLHITNKKVPPAIAEAQARTRPIGNVVAAMRSDCIDRKIPVTFDDTKLQQVKVLQYVPEYSCTADSVNDVLLKILPEGYTTAVDNNGIHIRTGVNPTTQVAKAVPPPAPKVTAPTAPSPATPPAIVAVQPPPVVTPTPPVVVAQVPAPAASKAPVILKDHMLVKEAITFLASACLGVDVVYDSSVTIATQKVLGDVTIPAPCSVRDVVKALNTKILPLSYKANIDTEGNLKIGRRPVTEQVRASTEEPEDVPERPVHPVKNDRRALVERLLARFPDAYEPNGDTRSFNQVHQVNVELNAMRSPVVVPVAEIPEEEGFGWRNAYNRSVYGYAYGPAVAKDWTNFVNENHMIGLRTEGNAIKVSEIWVNGCHQGDADQFRNWWNQNSALQSGKTLVITLRRRTDNKSYVRTAYLPSKAEARAAGMDHFTLGLWKENFDGGKEFDQDAVEKNCHP